MPITKGQLSGRAPGVPRTKGGKRKVPKGASGHGVGARIERKQARGGRPI